MPTHVEGEVSVKQFGYTADQAGRRLEFPRAVTHDINGRAGTVGYGGAEAIFDGLQGRLDTLRWTADAASIGAAWLRDDAGRFDIKVDRVEMSRGIMLTRADRGVEIVSPHVTFSEMSMTLKGPFGRRLPTVPPEGESAPVDQPGDRGLRQDRLRFLDSLSGRIYLTVKVVLDLPVLGRRSLDQQLRVPIQEGSLDFRALEDSLDWLEGQFLDLKHDDNKLAVTWKVPIFGQSRDLISWGLDTEASTLASFGRVPVRSIADFRIGSGRVDAAKRQGKKTLQAFSLDAIDIALSLVAPRSLEAGGGLIMFGGDDQPGIVDLKATGTINLGKPGKLHGTADRIDTTIKDVHIGPAVLTADRLHFDRLDDLEVVFDGFRPTCITLVVHRVTVTNLALKLGGRTATTP